MVDRNNNHVECMKDVLLDMLILTFRIWEIANEFA